MENIQTLYQEGNLSVIGNQKENSVSLKIGEDEYKIGQDFYKEIVEPRELEDLLKLMEKKYMNIVYSLMDNHIPLKNFKEAFSNFRSQKADISKTL